MSEDKNLQVLENVSMKTETGAEITVDVALLEVTSEYQGVKKVKRFWTPAEYDDGQVQIGKKAVRLYVPFMGAQGYTPTEDDVRALFAGHKIHGSGLVSKKGNDYEADFTFDAWTKPSYMKKKYFTGVVTPEFGD